MDLVGLLLTSVIGQTSNELQVETFGKLEGTKPYFVLSFDPKALINFGQMESRIPYIFSRVSELKLKPSAVYGSCPNSWSTLLTVNAQSGAAIVVVPNGSRAMNCENYALDENQDFPLLLPE
jgi:hypothetical protein